MSVSDEEINAQKLQLSLAQRILPSDFEDRTAALEKYICDHQAELEVLQTKLLQLEVLQTKVLQLEALQNEHKVTTTNNSFGPTTNVVNNCVNVTINHYSPNSSHPPPPGRHFSLEDMHPFDDDNFEEFLSVAQFQECGYSLVKLLQLSHFNPAFPEYMNFIQIPNCIDKAYVLSKDRRWVKVDFHTSLAALMWRLVRRVSKINPVEASKYEDDTSFFIGGMESISLKAIYGIASHTQMCIRKLCDLGICLPGDLM